MPAYLVRMIKDKDIVGIYSAPTIDYLIELVDECIAAHFCEYLKLPPGGIYWSGSAVAVPLPQITPKNEEQGYELIPGGPNVTEEWLQPFYEEERWTRLATEEEASGY